MENNDISGALAKMLEDPDALAKAMSIAKSLMGSMPDTAPSDTAQPSAGENISVPTSSQPSEAQGSHEPSAGPSIAAIAGLLGAGGGKGDPRCALLYALKPYMGHGRAEKIDTLVNMLRLADLAGGMLGGKLF